MRPSVWLRNVETALRSRSRAWIFPPTPLPKLTFQVIRRTIATLAQKKGTVKDVQGVMRHSRVATTTDVYMQELPEGVRATVDSIHNELHATMAKLASGSVTVH